MASFDEVRFPTDVDFGFTGGPEYSTDIVELFSGYEQRNANWSSPRMRFVATCSIKTQAQINTIIAFFRARKGRTTGFRFRDWSDYYVTGQVLGTGTGALTTFQFIKTYTSGGITETRTLTKIVQTDYVNTTPKIYLNGVLQGSGYSINYNTGVLTFSSSPGAGVIVSSDFEFDVPVRFDFDNIKIRHEYNQEYYIDNLTLIEVRIS